MVKRKHWYPKEAGIFLISFVILIVAGYVSLFVLSPGDSKSTLNEDNSYINLDQFSHTSEYHWDHMPITYGYEEECEFSLTLVNSSYRKVRDEKFISRVEDGLKFITDETNGAITFKEVGFFEEPDISYVCNNNGQYGDYIDAGGYVYWNIPEGLAHLSSYKGTNIFAPGYINLIGLDDLDCETDKPIIVIHETLHMFGIEHSTYSKDIMNMYYKRDCFSDISKEDIINLWNIYDPDGVHRPYGKKEYSCEEGYYSCRDFKSQASAQKVLEYCGVNNDIHNLDSDSDELACENLK